MTDIIKDLSWPFVMKGSNNNIIIGQQFKYPSTVGNWVVTYILRNVIT